MKRLRVLALVPFLAAASCEYEAPAPSSVPVAVTDTAPLGKGLQVIGFSLLGASVVLTLGRLLR